MAHTNFITLFTVLILTTLVSVSKAGTTTSTTCTENDLGDETCVTTTTTTTNVPGTTTGNILTNSTFGTSGYDTSGWTISGDVGHGHSTTSGTTYTGQNTSGGVLALEEDPNSSIYQDVDLVGDGKLTQAQINEGFTSTMSADIWFWNPIENTTTLKQTITASDGTITTQVRNINDHDPNRASNGGQWTNYTDSYTHASNTQTDFTIRAEVSNSTPGQTGHFGPDVDNVELSITTAGTTSSSSTQTSVTTLCFDRVPDTCTYDNDAVEDAVNLKTDDGKDLITAVDDDVKDAVNNFETVKVDTSIIVEDEFGEIEEIKFDDYVEQEFTNFLVQNNLVDDFKEELKVEGISEEEFFDELSGSMTEELGGEIMADMEDFKEEDMNDITTDTPTEELQEPKNEEITEEGELNATSTTTDEKTETTETVQSDETETETRPQDEDVPAKSTVASNEETERPEKTEDTDEVVEDETTVSVENKSVTVDAKVSGITEKVARVIKKLEAKLKRVDDKLKATSYVLAVGLQSTQPDISSYTNKRMYEGNKLAYVPNDDFFDTINRIEQQQIYKDATLSAYTSNDPIAVQNRLLNEIDMKKQKLKAEIAALRSN